MKLRLFHRASKRRVIVKSKSRGKCVVNAVVSCKRSESLTYTPILTWGNNGPRSEPTCTLIPNLDLYEVDERREFRDF